MWYEHAMYISRYNFIGKCEKNNTARPQRFEVGQSRSGEFVCARVASCAVGHRRTRILCRDLLRSLRATSHFSSKRKYSAKSELSLGATRYGLIFNARILFCIYIKRYKVIRFGLCYTDNALGDRFRWGDRYGEFWKKLNQKCVHVECFNVILNYETEPVTHTRSRLYVIARVCVNFLVFARTRSIYIKRAQFFII